MVGLFDVRSIYSGEWRCSSSVYSSCRSGIKVNRFLTLSGYGFGVDKVIVVSDLEKHSEFTQTSRPNSAEVRDSLV